MAQIAAAKQGDDLAFESLLEPLLQPAYRLAVAMLHDPHAAEDVLQESAFKAWRKLSRLREGSEMRPWFLGIVANECRSARRSRWRSVLHAEAQIDNREAIAVPENTVVEGIELRRTLREMDPAKRLVLVLHWYLDLPVSEIAVVIGSTVHGAEGRLTRATLELRRRMEARRGRP